MKKWFTTNYHYIVPEIEESTEIRLNGTKPFDEFNEAKARGILTKPVLIGPYTFLKLARNAQAEELTYDKGLVNAVAAVYAEVIKRFAALGAQWLQLDEPYLVLDKEDGDVSLFKSLYAKILPAREDKIKVLLNTYFGHIADVYETVNLLGFDGIGLDLNEGKDENLAAVEKYGVAENTTLFAGVVNGRNIWRNNYAVSLGLIDALRQKTDNVAVSTASSLLHVPFSTEGETALDPAVLKHFAFAVEKLTELKEIAVLADSDEDAKKASADLAANQALFDAPALPPIRRSPSASPSSPTPTSCASRPAPSVRRSSVSPLACRCCPPPPSAPSRRPRRFAPNVPSCVRVRSPSRIRRVHEGPDRHLHQAPGADRPRCAGPRRVRA